MANCPTCQKRSLSPTLLAPGLSAKSCQSCRGVLVDLLTYRAWAEQAGIDTVEETASSDVEVDDTKQAISCPNCGAVMTKYRLSASTDNKLDFCANCDEVWLDSGEWRQLDDLGLRKSLGSIFTEPWQRRVRDEIAEQSMEAVLRQRFGGDYERIAEIHAWIRKHPQREHILAWLNQRAAN